MKHKYLSYESNFLKNIQDVKKLLVVVAMDSEEKALVENQSYEQIQLGRRNKVSVKRIQLPRCQIFIAKSGVGLVNAGILINLVTETFDIDAVIQLGVGGALDEKLNTGDVVIAEQIVQHDSVATTPEQILLIAPGELTLSAPPDQQIDPTMRCDRVLIEWIESALNQKNHGKVFRGTILSGSEFSACAIRKKSLRDLHENALLVDMEAAAIAQLARRLSIAFVSAKTVADRANPSESISDDYLTFLNAANSHSSGVLTALLETFS